MPGARAASSKIHIVYAKYKCQCFPNLKNVSALGSGVGAEPPAERSARIDARCLRLEATPLFARAGPFGSQQS